MQDNVFMSNMKNTYGSLKQLANNNADDKMIDRDRLLEINDELRRMIQKYEAEYVDYKLICDNLTSTIFVTDGDGKILYVNPAYEYRAGLAAMDIIGKTIYDLQMRNIIQCDIIPNMIKTGEPSNEIGYVVPTNYRGFVSGIPIKDEDDKLVYAMTTDWDVTAIMELEGRLASLKKGNVDTDSDESAREISMDDDIWYISDAVRELLILARTIARTDVTVLVTGETGTGKELLSSTIVKCSNRSDKPFVKINCAAIPSNLLESELFGYEEGAFTGAQRGGKKGAFEEADGGTILLDEIGELPFQVQAKLLRVLQENEVVRIGGVNPISLDIRVIAATNRDLMNEIKEGNFREDLYYRLNIMPLELPPLRERPEDAIFLANKFLEDFNEKYKKSVILEPSAIRTLKGYNWPGNIRELKNLMERLVITCTDGRIEGSDIAGVLKIKEEESFAQEGETLKQTVERFEKYLIEEALRKANKNKAKAAEDLGVERTTLVKKCKKYEIE